VFVIEEPDAAHARSLLTEVEALLRPETRRAAMLIAWAAAEAAMRSAGRRAGIETDRLLPRQLLRILHERGILSASDVDELEAYGLARNTIAHGFRPVDLPVVYVERLVDLTRKLLGDPVRSGGILLATYGGGSLDQVAEVKARTRGASELLHEILGPSAGLVSAEWDRAEDERGRMVMTLTLSDFTGKVTATFTPEEFHEQEHLRLRFRRLWGDLLQLRAERLREELMSHRTGEAG
jgi:uncharacterized protein YutE (UPF0331/DUF86 family)